MIAERKVHERIKDETWEESLSRRGRIFAVPTTEAAVTRQTLATVSVGTQQGCDELLVLVPSFYSSREGKDVVSVTLTRALWLSAVSVD